LLGLDQTAGGAAWCWDPFEAHAQGLVTNPNVWIMGEPGNGKSALVKLYLYRQWQVYGPTRFVTILDPKGEYRPLAEAMGLPVVRLAPGGSQRVNPLDGPTGDGVAGHEARVERQAAMIRALMATMLRRNLTPVEEAGLWAAVSTALESRGSKALLSDVAALLMNPTAEMAAQVVKQPDELRQLLEALRYSLGALLTRHLRGMFDGPTTVPIDWDGPGVVPAMGWLQELMYRRDGRQKINVSDEQWRLLGNEELARFLQSCWKLGRSYGFANIAVSHRPSDLGAQADDGSATSKIARGLLSDTATKVLLKQAPDQLDLVVNLMGLSPAEAREVGALGPSQAIWRLGNRSALVDHNGGRPGALNGLVSSEEMGLIDTNDSMRGRAA
jgi:type IV secretory pathway VirB4 component